MKKSIGGIVGMALGGFIGSAFGGPLVILVAVGLGGLAGYYVGSRLTGEG